MFRFNKKVVLVLSFVMLLTVLVGCGDKAANNTTTGGNAGSHTNKTDDEPEVVYTINCTQSVTLFEQWQEKFAEYATELSNGRIGFDFYPTGSLGNSSEVITSTQMGEVDFVNAGDSELGAIIEGSDWVTLPYYVTNHEQVEEEVLNGFIGEFADKQYADAGLVSVSKIDISFRTLGIKDKVVESSEDIKGLRIRVPNSPMALRIYELMGALPVALSAPEVLIALEQGTVDGADNAIFLFEQFNQLELFETIVLLNYGFSHANLFCSGETWETIPEEDQKIIKEAGKMAADWYHAEAISYEEDLIERVRESGKRVIEPDQEWLDEIAKHADVIWEEAMESGKYDEEFINELHKLYLKNTNR